jgi:predicted neutral ceramidase superfamily lipid hydrolase
MKTYVTYGLLWAVAGAILTLAMFFLGFQSDLEKFKSGQLIAMVGGLIISIVFIVLGTKARRAEVPASEGFSYGQALGAGIMVGLFATLFGIVFNFIYTHYINTGMQDLIIQAQVDKWEAKGMSGAQLEGAEKMMRKTMNPAIQAVFYLVFGMIFSVIISLITSAFLKREPVEEPIPPVSA